jgi:hypothetical protein
VSAALRTTDRHIDAVEIDPTILGLGKTLHAERPYESPRVTISNDDARSFFERARQRYALIVFGFLDSHTLLSSFSSVRLDNFIYTRESLARARQLLLPGGRLCLSFASNTPWIHQRLIALVSEAFGRPALTESPPPPYDGAVLYQNTNLPASEPLGVAPVEVSTDDWPFLYLRARTIPAHYWGFIAIILVLGVEALLLLPRGSRRLRLPYFLLGAAFFLIETSNVVRLSLLFGSTWWVNVVVFSGILVLVLLANLTRLRTDRLRAPALFALLLLTVAAAYLVPTQTLLAIDSSWWRGVAAVAVFLGPVYFAALLFATLIKGEASFYEAYGSNILGAMVGGACEYLALVVGFRALLLLTLGLYLLAALAWPRR